MVATSEGGGRPCCQSRPLRWWSLHKLIHNRNRPIHSISSRSCCPWRWLAQVTASQRFLAPRPIGETPVGVSWQAVTATAAYSCDRTVAALLLRLGNGWRWQRRCGTGSGRRWAQDYSAFNLYIRPFLYRILIHLYSAFSLYIRPHNIVSIRPEKSAYLNYKMLCRFSVSVAPVFSIVFL